MPGHTRNAGEWTRLPCAGQETWLIQLALAMSLNA